jgi:hypothetical protein
VFGFLVRGRGVVAAIDLDEHEARRIGAIFEHVEASDARYLDARARVGERRFAEKFLITSAHA